MECIFISAGYINAHHIFLHYNLSLKKQSVASHLWTDGECFGKFISHVGRQRPGTRQAGLAAWGAKCNRGWLVIHTRPQLRNEWWEGEAPVIRIRSMLDFKKMTENFMKVIWRYRGSDLGVRMLQGWNEVGLWYLGVHPSKRTLLQPV